MHISEIDTPALLIDLDIMERNICRVAEYARKYDLRVRPHTKTHKSTAVGRRQLAAGAAGLTVAKVSEAEVMLGAAPPELLVAYPIIGHAKLERLVEVGRKTRVTVALDSLFAARQLSDAARAGQVTFGVLAETDVGLGRVGVCPGEELLHLARGIERLPRLRFEGVAFYPGHIKETGEGAQEALERLCGLLRSITEAFRRAGMPLPLISGGSTPTLFRSHELPGLNEIRPGTYVFNDGNTVATGACTLADCAASILVTVVSTAHRGQVIVDGGSKTFSSDRLTGAAEITFGHVTDAPRAVFGKMNEEHGYIDVSRAAREFAIGDRLRIIPNHVCTAMNLHEMVYGVRGDRVEETWKVEARGKLQ